MWFISCLSIYLSVSFLLLSVFITSYPERVCLYEGRKVRRLHNVPFPLARLPHCCSCPLPLLSCPPASEYLMSRFCANSFLSLSFLPLFSFSSFPASRILSLILLNHIFFKSLAKRLYKRVCPLVGRKVTRNFASPE